MRTCIAPVYSGILQWRTCTRIWAPGTPPLVFRPPTGMNQVPIPGYAPGIAQGFFFTLLLTTTLFVKISPQNARFSLYGTPPLEAKMAPPTPPIGFPGTHGPPRAPLTGHMPHPRPGALARNLTWGDF